MTNITRNIPIDKNRRFKSVRFISGYFTVRLHKTIASALLYQKFYVGT